MTHTNPLGHVDRFRSDERQRASDDLLPTLTRVASDTGPAHDTVRVTAPGVTDARARELLYSAAWFHDLLGQWVPNSDHDPRRLVHLLDLDVDSVDRDGFRAIITRRG